MVIIEFLVTDSNLKNEYRQRKLVFTTDPTRFQSKLQEWELDFLQLLLV